MFSPQRLRWFNREAKGVVDLFVGDRIPGCEFASFQEASDAATEFRTATEVIGEDDELLEIVGSDSAPTDFDF